MNGWTGAEQDEQQAQKLGITQRRKPMSFSLKIFLI